MSKRDETRSNEGSASYLSDELITKKELARRLRISQRKIELDLKMPTIRWNRTVRYDWQDVVEYLKGGTAS